MHTNLDLSLATREPENTHRDMEEQIARLHEQVQLFDLIQDAVTLYDMSGEVIFWNKGAEDMYGWTKVEAMGEVLHSLLQTQFPKPFEEIMPTFLLTKRWEGELAQTKRDGTAIIVSSRWALLDNTLGEPLATFKINTDITERKLIEARLAAVATQLHRSNRELEEFAAVASHDLQEPLRKIQAFCNRLAVKCADSLDEDSRDYLNRMLTAATRMRTLIDDLLDYSRLTINGRHYVKVDLGAICREVLLDISQQIERMGGHVEIGDLPTIEADAMQMRRLLQNLITNALKFAREGVPPVIKVFSRLLVTPTSSTGPLMTSSEPYSIDPKATELWEIIVQDEGIGFDEKYLDRIFAPFQRLHGRNEFEGTGMGLAICRKIAESHWGSITGKSTIGQGSTFMVTLPSEQPIVLPTTLDIANLQQGASF
ncbi:MAG: ATP-binding protein [Chloroflexia bacterium]